MLRRASPSTVDDTEPNAAIVENNKDSMDTSKPMWLVPLLSELSKWRKKGADSFAQEKRQLVGGENAATDGNEKFAFEK